MSAAEPDRVWTRVTVECPPAAAEAVSAILLDICPGGLFVEERAGVACVGGYFSPGPSGCGTALTRLRSALKSIPSELAPEALRIGAQPVPEHDWVEAFKRHCRPVRVGRIVVKPTWHR